MGVLIIKALVEFKKETNDKELTENEKTFLFSLGFEYQPVLNDNKINVFENYIDINFSNKYTNLRISYAEDNVYYLIRIYDLLEDRIFIGKILRDLIDEKNKTFDYLREPLKIFYKEFLTDEEKTHAVKLANELPKYFLQDVLSFKDIQSNIEEMFSFFELMYYTTDGKFRYNDKAVDYLIAKNKYNIHKTFFKHLRDVLLTYQKSAVFFNNMKDLLIKASPYFKEYMKNTPNQLS